jgi:hypothetical protein
MRKHVLNPEPHDLPLADQRWMNLEGLADVEVTSEDPAYPIEGALISKSGEGWRAQAGGRQRILLLFHEPQRIERLNLVFRENECARTQEFLLRWSSDGGRSYREILRQQFNFSPPNTTTECEDYTVELSDVTALELTIVPDITGDSARASLAHLRLA